MGKGHRRCEVCGIREIHTGDKLFFSKFPLDPDRCIEWLKAVGNEELVHLPIEKLHDQRNVCANHFRKVDFNKKGNRLKRHAIPTLHLMASPLTDSQLAEFPQHVYLPTKPQDSTPPVEEDKENMTEIQSGCLSEPHSGLATKATLLKQLVLKKMTPQEDVRDHLSNFMDVVGRLEDMNVKIHPELLSIMMLYSLPTNFDSFRTAIESRDVLPSPDNLKINIVEEYEARRQTEASEPKT